jgi:hypothetical protein
LDGYSEGSNIDLLGRIETYKKIYSLNNRYSLKEGSKGNLGSLYWVPFTVKLICICPKDTNGTH